jgi:hypothetical protein
MAKSPAVILYDATGIAMAVQDGIAIPASTRGLLIAGKGGGGVARFANIKAPSTPAVAADEALVVTISPNNTVTVTPSDSEAATYSAQADNFLIGNPATDVFTITGSASKLIRIREIQFSGTRTTAGDFAFTIVSRSTANSGGTSTLRTAVPHDSTLAAATATVRAYTVSPTLGTLIGAIRSGRVYFSGNGSTSVPNQQGYEFEGIHLPVILRGTSEVLAGGSVCAYVEWTEE